MVLKAERLISKGSPSPQILKDIIDIGQKTQGGKSITIESETNLKNNKEFNKIEFIIKFIASIILAKGCYTYFPTAVIFWNNYFEPFFQRSERK